MRITLMHYGDHLVEDEPFRNDAQTTLLPFREYSACFLLSLY